MIRDRHERNLVAAALFVALVIALLGLLTYGLLTRAPRTGIDDRLGQGRSALAPGFDLPVLQKGELRAPALGKSKSALADGRIGLAELRGGSIVLNFWASWCSPCREEAPLLERAWQRWGSRGVLFLGLNMQDLSADARSFLREFHTTYPNIRDQDNDVAVRWGVVGLPETFFIDPAGEVVSHVIGAVSEDQIAEGVEATGSGEVMSPAAGGGSRPTR